MGKVAGELLALHGDGAASGDGQPVATLGMYQQHVGLVGGVHVLGGGFGNMDNIQLT